MAMYEDFMNKIAGLAPEEQQSAFGQLPPEVQQQIMANYQQQQQQQNPNMGLTPQQKIDAGNPDAFRDYEGEQNIISDEQAQAEQLRATATPQGIQTGTGYVAANPLAHIATAGQRIMGNIDAKKALAKNLALTELRTKTAQDVAEKARQRDIEKEMMEQEMRNNRRGGTPMQMMSDNQYEQGSA